MAYLIKTIKNPHGFSEQLLVLEGDEQYLSSTLDDLDDDEVMAFHITDVKPLSNRL